MKTLSRVLFLGAVLCSAVACGKNSALQAAESYQQETCACADKRCAEQAARKFIEAVENKPVTASSAEADGFSKAKAKALGCASGLPEVSSAQSTGTGSAAAGKGK